MTHNRARPLGYSPNRPLNARLSVVITWSSDMHTGTARSSPSHQIVRLHFSPINVEVPHLVWELLNFSLLKPHC